MKKSIGEEEYSAQDLARDGLDFHKDNISMNSSMYKENLTERYSSNMAQN